MILLKKSSNHARMEKYKSKFRIDSVIKIIQGVVVVFVVCMHRALEAAMSKD